MNSKRNVVKKCNASITAVALVASGFVALAVASPNAQAASPLNNAVASSIDTACKVGGVSFPWGVNTVEPGLDYGLNQPTKIASDAAGNVFAFDAGNGLVRRYANNATHTMTIVAGGSTNAANVGRDDLPATQNNFAVPANTVSDIAVDPAGTTLYIADADAVRRVNLATGAISTIAGVRGNNTTPFPTDGQLAAGQHFGSVTGVAATASRVYVMSSSFANESPYGIGRLYAIELTGATAGTVSRVAGAQTAGDIYNVGEGAASLSATSVSATGVEYALPSSISVDDVTGMVYQLSVYGRLLRFDPVSGQMLRVAGGAGGFSDAGDGGAADSAQIPGIVGLSAHNGVVVIAQSSADRIRYVNGGLMRAFAGSGVAGFSGDGTTAVLAQPGLVQFAHPSDVAQDAAGNVYIADTNNHRIRKILDPMGVATVTTIGGDTNPVTNAPTPHVGQGVGGPATGLLLQDQGGIAADDAGGYFIADNSAHVIYYVDANGTTSVVAGTGKQGFYGTWINGQNALSHSFGETYDASGSGQGVGKLRFVQTLAGRFLYFFDAYDLGASGRVARMALDQPGRPIATVMGDGGASWTVVDGGLAVNQSGAYSSYAVDSAGNVYVADRNRGKVYKIDPSGVLHYWAGAATAISDYSQTLGGGNRLVESIGYVVDIDAANDGTVYFSSRHPSGGSRIFKIGANDNVTLIGGTQGNGDIDGVNGEPAIGAHMATPHIKVDSNGQVFLLDDFLLRRIDPVSGNLYRVAGPFDGVYDNARLTLGDQPQPALQSKLASSTQFDVAADGTILVAEDFRNSGSTALLSVTPMRGANRVRRLVSGTKCSSDLPVASQISAGVQLMNLGSISGLPTGDTYGVSSTPDLKYVAISAQTNGGEGGRLGTVNTYLFDRLTGRTTLVNLRSDGQPDEAGATLGLDATTSVLVRPSDGHVLVAFTTAGQLLPTDTDNMVDVYIKDMTTGVLTQASYLSGQPSFFAGEQVYHPYLYRDGTAVAVEATISGSALKTSWQLNFGSSTPVTIDGGQIGANGDIRNALVSDDGRTKVFVTNRTNSQYYVGNGLSQIVRYGSPTTFKVLSQTAGAALGTGDSQNPKINSDASIVAFEFQGANNLSGGFVNDVLVYREGATNLLSLNSVRTAAVAALGGLGVRSLSAMTADGTKLIVQVQTASGVYRPFLVDIAGSAVNGIPALWRALDGAGPGAVETSSPLSFNTNTGAGDFTAAMDDSGRRVAIVTPHDLGLAPSAMANAKTYLRDVRQTDAVPPPTASMAAVSITTVAHTGTTRVLPDGSVIYWVGSNLMHRFVNGSSFAIFNGPAGSPIATDAAGNIFVAVGSQISKIIAGTSNTLVWPNVSIGNIISIAVSPVSGDPYVSTDTNRIYRWSPYSFPSAVVNASGTKLCNNADGGPAFSAPTCGVGPIVFDAQGNLTFVDHDLCFGTPNCDRIRRLVTAPFGGAITAPVAGQFGLVAIGAYEDRVDARSTPLGHIIDMAIAADGTTYIIEEGLSRIRRIAPNHTIVTAIGNGLPSAAALPAVPTAAFGAPTGVSLAANGQVVYSSNLSGQINMLVDVQINLTSSSSISGQGVSIIPTQFIPTRAIDTRSTAPGAQNIASIGFGTIGNEPLSPTVQASPLKAIPLKAIPLKAILLDSIPLKAILLSQIPVDYPGGWQALLSGTAMAGKPLQTVTFFDVLNLGTATPAAINDLPFGALDLSSTPLKAIALASVALGATPLKAIPLPSTVPGATVLDQWCSVIVSNGLNCLSDFGIDPSLPSSGDAISLVSLSLAGVPLKAIPLKAIPLKAIDLSASPLKAIPLKAINLEASPLKAIPLKAIVLASSPLKAIPLKAIPLKAIDISPSPLKAIPLKAIANVATMVDCTKVDCTATSVDTLETAASVLPASAILDGVTLETLVNSVAAATIAAYTLGDLKEYGTATIGDLVQALTDNTYTFGDLLKALIPVQDYPWQDVNLAATPDLRVAATQPGAGGLASALIHYTVDINVMAATPYTASSLTSIGLLASYQFVPGSLMLRHNGVDTPLLGSLSTDVATPFAAGFQNGDQISFDVIPGLDLGSGNTSVDMTALTVLHRNATYVTNVVGQWEEPNNTLATAYSINPDTMYLGHIAPATDVDLFKITVAEGQTMSAILSNLPADFDLTLYAPAPAVLGGKTPDRILVPVQDEPTGLKNDGTATPANPANDIALENALVYAIAQRHDTGDERIDTGRLHAGTYYLKVTGYNGAASTKPYALRVTMESSGVVVPPCQTWSFVGDSVNRGTLPASTSYAGANTILVVNQERLFGKYPAQAASVMTSLNAFVAATNANSALGVKAVIVSVDGDSAVHAAYQNWEGGTNRCDPLAARSVSSAVGATLDAIESANPSIKNVVMIGGDDVIPFGRVADTTRIANERDFAQELTGNNEISASARGGWMLTDDVYVDHSPTQIGSGELYVPNLTVGRLVESPADISSALSDFVANQGNLDARTALSVGYDFLSDGATAVKDSLTKNGFTTSTNATNLIGDTWNAQNLKDALLGLNGATVPSIAAVNAHFDDHRALPADQNTTQSQTNLFTTADLGTARTLARSLLFSVGCHSGLSIADTTDSSRGADWAQSYASQGAIWLGNTGFGYGDTTAVAASEKLMANFAEKLDGHFTVGQALLLAKQRYVGDLGSVITGYDMKVSQEMTYYGLPMYRLRPAAAAPPTLGPESAVTNDPRVNLPVAPLIVLTPINTSGTAQPGTIDRRIESRGTYYTVNGGVLTVQNRPIQPLTTRDVTRVNPTTGVSDGIATGMLVTGLVSQDQFGVNPAVYRPVIDSKNESEPATTESVFPAAPISIGNSTDLVTVGGQTVSINRQTAAIVPGQFRADATGNSGTQRLFTQIDGQVYYAPNGNTDTSPPTIYTANASVTAGGASITVTTDDNGIANGVKRVFVLAAPAIGSTNSVAWFGTDLVKGLGNTWIGEIAVPTGTTAIDYIVQVVDASGNVGVSSNKGELFATSSVTTPPPLAPVVTFVPSVPSSGWLNGAATVTATDPNAGGMSYSVDGGTAVSYNAPFMVSGTGSHTVSVVNLAGLTTSVRVPIDMTGPSISVSNPTSGTTYAFGQLETAAYFCSDGESGVASCNGSVASGSVVDTSTSGPHSLMVTATDAVGNVTTTTVNYSVAAAPDHTPPTVVCGAVPSAWSAIDVSISCTATDAGGLASAGDAAFALITSVASGTETATASTGSRTVCDLAGNCVGVGPFTGIKVDRKAPVVSLSTPANGASYNVGQVVNASYSCVDGGSGLNASGCVGTAANGAGINTVSAGVKTFTVNVTDAVGNTATTSVSYTVVAVATNQAPVVKADLGIASLNDIGFQGNAVVITGSFTDPDGSGPYTSMVRWTATGAYTPLVLNSSSQFVAAYVYSSAGVRQVTVKICDKLGACGTSAITVRTGVTQRVTPTRCIVDKGATVNPRYQVKYGYNNPASFAIVVPIGTDNGFTTGSINRGQPTIFTSGSKSTVFSTTFQTGSVAWKLNGTTLSSSATSPKC